MRAASSITYLTGWIYPDGLTRTMQIALGATVSIREHRRLRVGIPRATGRKDSETR